MKSGLFSILVFLVLLFPGSSFAATVVISSGEYAPYTGMNLPHGGFVNHVVQEAFRLVGVNAKFRYYPWARAFHLARTGDVAAVSYVYRTRKRESEYLLSDQITEERLVLFCLKGTKLPADWKSLADLKDYTFGLTRDFSYTDEFWDLVGRGVLKTDPAKNDKMNFRKLARKRIDVFPADELVGYTILRNEFAPALADIITGSEKTLAVHIGTLAFPKTEFGKKLRDEFNKGLAQLIADGTYDLLYESLLCGGYAAVKGGEKGVSE